MPVHAIYLLAIVHMGKLLCTNDMQFLPCNRVNRKIMPTSGVACIGYRVLGVRNYVVLRYLHPVLYA